MMNRSTVVAFATLAVASIGVAFLTAGARPEGQSLAAGQLVGAFERSQSATDELPKSLSSIARDAQLELATSRFLGRSSLGTHWVALDDDGSVCLLTSLDEGSVAGGNCMPRQQFATNGAALRVTGPTGRGEVAHLLPPGVTTDDVPQSLRSGDRVDHIDAITPAPEFFVEEGLVVMDVRTADAVGRAEVPRKHLDDLVLPSLRP